MVFPRFASSSRQGRPVRPTLEQLEDRCVLSLAGNPAVIPAPNAAPFWQLWDAQMSAAPKGDPHIVFLGDSITAGFAKGAGSILWSEHLAPLGAADLAISGNTTANVLWQIQQGVLDGIDPKAVVLMIGTNNLGFGESPEQIAEGVAACLQQIEAKLPQTQVLLLGILPRGQSASDMFRGPIAQTNQILAGFADGNRVHYLDLGSSFVEPDGTISSAVLYDYLHPNVGGYQILTSALLGPLEAALVGRTDLGIPALSTGTPSGALAKHTDLSAPAIPQLIIHGTDGFLPGADVLAALAAGQAAHPGFVVQQVQPTVPAVHPLPQGSTQASTYLAFAAPDDGSIDG